MSFQRLTSNWSFPVVQATKLVDVKYKSKFEFQHTSIVGFITDTSKALHLPSTILHNGMNWEEHNATEIVSWLHCHSHALKTP
jgi:hypothetical protein